MLMKVKSERSVGMGYTPKGSSISASIEDLTYVLMNYLIIYKTSWGKGIKCEACRAFYLFFALSLINSIARMLDSIYHMTLRLL